MAHRLGRKRTCYFVFTEIHQFHQTCHATMAVKGLSVFTSYLKRPGQPSITAMPYADPPSNCFLTVSGLHQQTLVRSMQILMRKCVFWQEERNFTIMTPRDLTFWHRKKIFKKYLGVPDIRCYDPTLQRQVVLYLVSYIESPVQIR
jgi:hypothetical protein